MDTELEYTIALEHLTAIATSGRSRGSRLRFELGSIKIYVHTAKGVKYDHFRVSLVAQALTASLGRSQSSLRDVLAGRKLPKRKKVDARQMELPLFGKEE